MTTFSDALYERITFGVKDDEDFSWSSNRSNTLELISNDDRELIGYRLDENWVLADDIDEVSSKFVAVKSTVNFLSSSKIIPSMANDMVKAIVELETGNLERKYTNSFTILENNEKITENYDGCFFIEQNCVSTSVTVNGNDVKFNNVSGDGDVNDIFEEYQNELNNCTTIIVLEELEQGNLVNNFNDSTQTLRQNETANIRANFEKSKFFKWLKKVCLNQPEHHPGFIGFIRTCIEAGIWFSFWMSMLLIGIVVLLKGLMLFGFL